MSYPVSADKILTPGKNHEVTLQTETEPVPLLSTPFNGEVVQNLQSLGWSEKMVSEYSEMIEAFRPMTSLIAPASARKNNTIGRHIEGRGIHLPIDEDTKITEGTTVPKGWSLYLKGGNTAKKITPSTFTTLEDNISFHDGTKTFSGIVPRIEERQYATTAKQEYISWLSFISNTITAYNITSWKDCFRLGIPIMLPPVLLQDTTDNMRTLAEKSSLDSEQRAEIEAGLGLTIVLFPGDSRLQTRYRGIPNSERVVEHIMDSQDIQLFAHVARLVRNLVRIGKMSDYGSSHAQQIVDTSAKILHAPTLPIADFMDMQDIYHFSEADRTALIFRRFYGLMDQNIIVFDAKLVSKQTREAGMNMILNELLKDTSVTDKQIQALATIAAIIGSRPVIAVASGILALEGSSKNTVNLKSNLEKMALQLQYPKEIPCDVDKLWKEDLHPEHVFDIDELKKLNTHVIKIIARAMSEGNLLHCELFTECLQLMNESSDTTELEGTLQAKYNIDAEGNFRTI